MSTYAWVDLGAVVLPFLFSFHPRLRFYTQWPALAVAVPGMMALFVPWDVLFTTAGVWGFHSEHVWSMRLFHLPVEEWLFFLCVPYACLFTYHCSRIVRRREVPGPWVRAVSLVLVIGLAALALWDRELAYTSTACMGCALWVGFSAFVQRAPWLGRFFLTYAVLLLPFLVVNGVLTGWGLQRAVVWYNDRENLGVRILTIPVEDVLYGLLMVGLTTSFYETVLTLRTRSHERSFTAPSSASDR